MPVQTTINKTKVPIKIWASSIESEAIDQAVFIADNMPVYNHVALMADAHVGKGMPIGGVVPLINAVCPNMVGVDIGCGMLAIKTNLTSINIDTLKTIYKVLRENIPVGFNKRDSSVFWEGFNNVPNVKAIKDEIANAEISLGTLGGGNHFLEVQKGDDGYIYWMIHSGSRNLGLKIANYYHDLAVNFGIIPNKNMQLAYFKVDTVLGREYINAMNFALEFAYQNRLEMANIIISTMKMFLNFDHTIINIHHNYAFEYEKFVYLHRKGATDASGSQIGIIPGSQGNYSYLVKGKDNKESFSSCSHGAGRKFSRSKAKKELNIEDCIKHMRDFGLECDSRGFALDEADEAYKDIKTVMADQSDLVDIITELRPYKLPAIKG